MFAQVSLSTQSTNTSGITTALNVYLQKHIYTRLSRKQYLLRIQQLNLDPKVSTISNSVELDRFNWTDYQESVLYIRDNRCICLCSLSLKCVVQVQQTEKGEGASLWLCEGVGGGRICSSQSRRGLHKVLSGPHICPWLSRREDVKHSLVEILRLVGEDVMARSSDHPDFHIWPVSS